MSRLTDNDKKFGPITYGKAGWKNTSINWSSGDCEESGKARNSLTVYIFGYIFRVYLPSILRPFKVKHIASTWDAATVARIGRNWYFETFPREYGIRISNGHLVINYGRQTHDSGTEQNWGCFLPWTQWRFVRHSLYDLCGEAFWTQRGDKKPFDSMWAAQEQCPKVSFEFDDYDGHRITATTMIEEREWLFGTGWFRWLSWFRKPNIRRSLKIEFSAEVGPEKGSWKGGTLGHGIEMLPGELHEAAFRRYCNKTHDAKGRKYGITFIGRAPATTGAAA